MKSMIGWAAVAAGVAAATYVLMNMPGPEYATGSDTVEGAARRTSAWGSQQRLASVGSNLAGRAKEAVGRMTGNADMMDRGTVDRVAGAVKDSVGEVAQAAGQTIHDLNR